MITTYTVIDCYIEIDGAEYPVAAFNIDLTENAIPTIVISLDSHNYDYDAAKSTPPAETPTPEQLIAIYNIFQKYCEDRATANFVFKAQGKNEDGKEDTQQIVLENWICFDSGFKSIQATGYSAFTITLKHPILSATQGPSSLLSAKYIPPDDFEDDMQKTKDPYSGLLLALELYLTTVGESQPGQGKPDLTSQKKQFQEAIDALKANVTNELKSYPIAGSDFTPAFKHTTFDYATSFKESSIWNVLAGTLCSEFFVSLKPNFNKVVISSLQPWADSKYAFSISDIINIQLPSNDLEPISGASCIVNEDIISVLSTFGGGGSGDIRDTSYFDGCTWTEIKNKKPVKGTILRVGFPQWFIAGLRQNAKGPGVLSPSVQEDLSTDVLLRTAIEDQYMKELEKLTKTVFLIKYRQAVSMVFTMRLCLQYNNVDLLPGAVGHIYGDNGELLRGYIVSVRHVVDVAAKQAQTEVSMRYVRQRGFTVMNTDSVYTPIWENDKPEV